jgi:hypothetical protein
MVPSGTYAATKAQIDVQIATARSYPRNLSTVGSFLQRAVATDEETAVSCIYSLPRGNTPARGPSIRFAEILTMAWGHMRVWSRIVDEGPTFVVVAGGAHDLQTNNVFEQEVVRRIVDSRGNRYSPDMIQQTVNAAASIAQRNSVLKVIPEFIWRPAEKACLDRIVGDVKTLNERRIKAIGQFALFGVTPEQIFKKLGVADVNGITGDHLVNLVGIFNAIRESQTTVDEQFGTPTITTPSIGGASPLAASEDSGAEPEPPALTDPPAEAAPPAPPAKPAEAPAMPPEQTKAFRPKAERKPRGPRQDTDEDLPRAAQPAPPPPTAKKPFDQLLREWENDCLAAKDLTTLRQVAVRYGEKGVFDNLSEDQRDRVNDAYDGAEAAMKAEAQRKASESAAADYARMKAGDEESAPSEMYDRPADNTVGGVDDEAGPAPADAPAAPPERDELAEILSLVSDVAPVPGEHYDTWLSIVKRLAAQATPDAVMAEYKRCEDEGLIAKLPEMVATNMRTVRFRIKRSKG